MNNLKLVHQLFIGKVIDEIGMDKTTKLLKEAKEAFAIHGVSNLLCGSFQIDPTTSSATKCICGREKWEHPKAI